VTLQQQQQQQGHRQPSAAHPLMMTQMTASSTAGRASLQSAEK
jgi:hypothetical protein